MPGKWAKPQKLQDITIRYAIARKAVDAIRAIVAYIGACGLVGWHKIRIFVSPMNRINAN